MQAGTAALDVLHPSGERARIRIDPVPFRIGRGPENHLILRDNRASRAHARIDADNNRFLIEDLGSLHGTWVNGQRTDGPTPLQPGDSIHFGFEDSYRLIFSSGGGRIERVLGQLSSASSQGEGAAGHFARLRALIDVARSLQTSLAADEVLGAIVDAALAVTQAERGFLLLRTGDDLETRVARDASGLTLNDSAPNVPKAVIQRALRERSDVLSMTLDPSQFEAEHVLQPEIRNIICVPLVQFRSVDAQRTVSLSSQSNTAGLLYLDSRQRQSPLSEIDRELLHTLALEASGVLENARLLEQEREARLREQEMEFARKIQQSLSPQKFPDLPWLGIAASTVASAEVAGDYFDVHAIEPGLCAAVIADVSGKGVSAALLAALLQGAFLIGAEIAALDILMARINHFLIERTKREKYATLLYATLTESGALAWINAGHTEPVLLRSDGSVERLRTTGMPLGLLATAKFEMERLQLSRGDKIVAYSDGLTDAENPTGERFDRKLDALLGDGVKRSALELHDAITREVARFQEGEPLRDDITLLVIEFAGAR